MFQEGDAVDVLRMVGGPWDGSELDVEDLFAGRMPGALTIGPNQASGRLANYDLDIDSQGTHYRFAGWQGDGPAAPDPLPARTE